MIGSLFAGIGGLVCPAQGLLALRTWQRQVTL